MGDLRRLDPVRDYDPSELKIASEFLSRWLPFLCRDLCHDCTHCLSKRIRDLDPDVGSYSEPAHFAPSTPNNVELHDHGNSNSQSLGGRKSSGEDLSARDSRRDWSNSSSRPVSYASPSGRGSVDSKSVRKSWADMAQEEDRLEEDEDEVNQSLVDEISSAEDESTSLRVQKKPELSRDQRERIRFLNVKRYKDFKCFEKFKGEPVNILQGLELHAGIFSAAEQRKIVDFVYKLEEMGRNGELMPQTYTAPEKWMRGKGRVTIQFGCCYNYAKDKEGNPPGILQKKCVDPLPDLFKVMIKRLVRWHVLPPSCVPDSCIVNIYDEGDCIPPHIDNHDFVRPFCTVSFLSECDILFGSNLKILGAGEFSGSFAIPLPVGSVLVLNGNGADVAKHCVPAVPTKRISITFRKMDESKRPFGFVPEADLMGLQPLSYDAENGSKRLNSPKPQRHGFREDYRRENVIKEVKRSVGTRAQRAPPSRPYVRTNWGNGQVQS